MVVAEIPPCQSSSPRRQALRSMGSAAGWVVTSRRSYSKVHFPGLLLPVPPSLQQAPLVHTSTGDPLTRRQVCFSLLWGHCSFPLGLGARRSCLCLPTVESVSPNPEEVLWSNPSGHQSCILWRFPVPLSDSQAEKPDMELRTFTTVGELFWYYGSPVCGSPTQQVWVFILLRLCLSYHLIVASSLCLNMGYPLFWGSSVLLSMVVQQLIVILVFSQEEMRAYPPTLPSWTRDFKFF